MGTQIRIEGNAMRSAGWAERKVLVYDEYYDDNTGEYVPPCYQHEWVRGDDVVTTYVPGIYYWDSRHGGSNRARQEALGLLDLPHEFDW